MLSDIFQPTVPYGLPPFYQIALLIVLSALAGLVVYFACRYFYRGLPVNRQYEEALLPASMIAAILLHQSANWPVVTVLAIAVIAIFHYRKAVEDAGDILFLFWAVLSGVFCGIGYPVQTLILDVVILLVIVLVIKIRLASTRFSLMISYDRSAKDRLDSLLKPLGGRVVSERSRDAVTDLEIRVRMRDVTLETVERISEIEGVHNAVIVSRET